ncbi:MAG: hypothetical protein LLG37_06345 [Spirochaetia bacterium]|nr:hypothetical protein [Spirochaetia bacterium]
MKVINPRGPMPVFRKKSAVTVGVFDGVHIGHRRLIEHTIGCSGLLGGKSVVVTFSTLPEKHLQKNTDLKLIKSIHARLKRIRMHGADYACLLEFNDVKNLPPEEFVT